MPLCIEEKATPRARESTTDIVLDGATADAYVARLIRAVRAARLNALFPPSQALVNHLSFLGPSGSHGLCPTIRVSAVNGLPTPFEVYRVKIDKELAAQFLERNVQRTPAAPESRLGRKVAYYRALREAEILPVNRMTVALRRQDVREGVAYLRVVQDRFDLATNQFVRYTILLMQRDSAWRRPLVDLDRDLEAPTERFRRIVSRFASHEAELAFVLLSEVGGLEVEDVRRGRIGPLLMPGAKVGRELETLLDPTCGPCAGGPAPWILCCPEDRAGVDVRAHVSHDPLAPLFKDAVGEQARALIDRKADLLGYRVAKGRKFVCPEPLCRPLTQLCRKLGTPCIVRGVGAQGLAAE
ncbi:MAG: hypothetical protein GF331_00605 [Chitinivibrionales bacterium]|nr:hypothetical protein [Chitinivibrionales bacterium]